MAKRINLITVLNATATARGYRESCRKVVEDPERAERLAKPECVLCHYYFSHAGVGIKKDECGLCGKEMRGSSNMDLLCPECAREHRLCRHCGADLELKNRRKL